MTQSRRIIILFIIIILFTTRITADEQKTLEKPFIPLSTIINRQSYSELLRRSLDGFGAYRKEGHKHAGLDIQAEYGESVFSIGVGIVEVIYGDFPYKTVIIKHIRNNGELIYSAYTHIEDIKVKANEVVNEKTKIGRTFTNEEFIKSEFYKNHIHFEIRKTMERYKGISIKCYTKDELCAYFYNPLEMFKQRLDK